MTTSTVFSGETKRVDIPPLNRLFGPNVPIEAISFLWTAPADMSLADAREAILAMARSWDQAQFHLNRLIQAATSIGESVRIAAERLADAEEPERTYLIADFVQAADNLEAADQDARFLRCDREE